MFVVGAPRSGGTLLHAALSRHAELATDGDAPSILAELAAERGLKFFDWASDEDLADAGRTYRQRHHARAVNAATENASFAIDAALENIWWLGAAAQYLEAEDPGFWALVIRRDMKPQLDDLGARLQAIRRMEDHWLATMPDRVKLVEYEKLVSEPAAVLADVFAWLGVGACELCLRPDETESALTSAGATEARGPPFHAQSLAAWKRYEPLLAREVFPHLK